ncbi:MAG: NUDIX domain-containing protein [Paenisporosarcina sp.]
MDNELLKIFDEKKNHIGVATREEVHRFGYWHDAFHCWFVSKENGIDTIYLQHRSKTKKDYPNLLDITAAGHLLATETIEEGVREIKEELGLIVSFQELIPLGVIEYSVTKHDFIDNEIAHLFLFKTHKNLKEFSLQKDEVAGMYKAEFNQFAEIWLGNQETMKIEGFEINELGEKVFINKMVSRMDFVPHHLSYYQFVIQKINEKMIN